MNSLMMPVILCFTVVASVGLGILAAYAVVFSILYTFRQPLCLNRLARAGLGPHTKPRQRGLSGPAYPTCCICHLPYFVASTKTAVPYASTSVTPCMISVAS